MPVPKDYPQMRRYVANAAYLSAVIALVLTVGTGILGRGVHGDQDIPAEDAGDRKSVV